MQSDCIDHGCKGFGLGYATAKYQGRYTTKHRVALLKHLGLGFDEAEGLEARHLCHNPRCINPEHLVLGTHKENMQDSVSAGRMADSNLTKHVGEGNGRCVLTDAQVAEFRAAYVKGSRTHGLPAMAAKYGVGTSQLHRIIKGWQRN